MLQKISLGSKKCFILSKILIKYALFYQNTLILYGFRAQIPPRFRKMGSHDVQNGHIPRGWFFIFIKYALFDRNALVLYVFFQKFAHTTSKMDISHSLLMIEVNCTLGKKNPSESNIHPGWKLIHKICNYCNIFILFYFFKPSRAMYFIFETVYFLVVIFFYVTFF